MYLSKLQNEFVQIAKSICPNCQMYLSKLQNVFVTWLVLWMRWLVGELCLLRGCNTEAPLPLPLAFKPPTNHQLHGKVKVQKSHEML